MSPVLIREAMYRFSVICEMSMCFQLPETILKIVTPVGSLTHLHPSTLQIDTRLHAR